MNNNNQNPFYFNGAISPSMRDTPYVQRKEISKVVEGLVDGRSYTLITPRSSGSSTLSLAIQQELAHKNGFIPVYIDLSNLMISNTEQVFLMGTYDIKSELQQRDIGLNENNDGTSSQVFTNYLNQLVKQNPDAKVVLIIDGTYRSDPKSRAEFIDHLSVILESVKRGNPSALYSFLINEDSIPDLSSPYRRTETIFVQDLDADRISALLVDGLGKAGFSYTDSGLSILVDESGGHPKLAQILGYNAIKVLPESRMSTLSPHVANLTVEKTYASEEFFHAFRGTVTRIGSTGSNQEVVQRILNGEAIPYSVWNGHLRDTLEFIKKESDGENVIIRTPHLERILRSHPLSDLC